MQGSRRAKILQAGEEEEEKEEKEEKEENLAHLKFLPLNVMSLGHEGARSAHPSVISVCSFQ